MTRTLAGALLLLAALPASASDPLAYAQDPQSLIAELERRPPPAVVRELYSSESWASSMASISGGNPDWLRAGLSLRAGTDGGATSELDEALSRALITNPRGVLEVVLPKVRPAAICYGSVESSSFEVALNELQRKIASLSAVTDPGLRDRRDPCLAALRNSEADLRRFYGPQAGAPAAQQGVEPDVE